MTPSPMFAQLVRRNPRYSPAPAGTRVARLRDALADGPMTPVEMAELIGRGRDVIHGLMKHDRVKGRVLWDGARYSLNPDYDDALADQIKRAAALLMRHGYTVAKPVAQELQAA